MERPVEVEVPTQRAQLEMASSEFAEGVEFMRIRGGRKAQTQLYLLVFSWVFEGG